MAGNQSDSIISGKMKAVKDEKTEAISIIKAEVEEFDFNSDDIVIVTDSDNEESGQDMVDQSPPVSKQDIGFMSGL